MVGVVYVVAVFLPLIVRVGSGPVQISHFEQQDFVVAATGTEIYLWNPQTQVHEQLTGHQASISTIAMAGDTLLSADSSGVIMGWSLKAKKSVWKIRSS